MLIIDELLFLANQYIEKDPCGAATLRRAARMLSGAQEIPCEYCRKQYGYGYTAGYKRGVAEWSEGLSTNENAEASRVPAAPEEKK